MSPFMDHAESLGVRPVLEMIAAHYASRYPGTVSNKQLCLCAISPFGATLEQRYLLAQATHDLCCPVHRIVILCGAPEDIAAVVEKSHGFALECLRILAAPDLETVQDHEFARSVVFKEHHHA